jgi:hypothetical protein
LADRFVLGSRSATFFAAADIRFDDAISFAASTIIEKAVSSLFPGHFAATFLGGDTQRDNTQRPMCNPALLAAVQFYSVCRAG